jgi:hypothetical protein
MSEAERKMGGLWCSILRQASYRPGTWLLSDKHDGVWLCHTNPDVLLKMNQHILDEMCKSDEDRSLTVNGPYMVLAHDTRAGGQRCLVAKPAIPGEFAFGGNWLWSDAPEFPASHPIPIHDAPILAGPDES